VSYFVRINLFAGSMKIWGWKNELINKGHETEGGRLMLRVTYTILKAYLGTVGA